MLTEQGTGPFVFHRLTTTQHESESNLNVLEVGPALDLDAVKAEHKRKADTKHAIRLFMLSRKAWYNQPAKRTVKKRPRREVGHGTPAKKAKLAEIDEDQC